VSTTTRSRRLLALVAGASLVVAACGDDDDDEPAATSGEPTETTAAGASTTAAGAAPSTTTGGAGTTTPGTGTTGGSPPSGEAQMTITYDINPDAVWEDGSPITWEDFECTYQANLNTPGSISPVGYEKILSVAAGASDQQVIVEFAEPYAPYKDLFESIMKKAAFADCNDVSAEMQTEFTFSGSPYMLESWSEEQSILVKNPNYWGDEALVDRIVMVPRVDADTMAASLKAGEVDFLYPQAFTGYEQTFADPNVKVIPSAGGDYEAIYFQQLEGPLADPVLREALFKSIDVDAFFQQIYAPFAAGNPPLTCGPIIPGPYCPDDTWQDTYDPEGAVALLEGDGWAKDASGFWAKDGEAPEIRWMINTPNPRREAAQDFLIPLLQQAGFNVVEDNGTAEEVFQQRLPALDYDMGMYISTAPPDPGYLTPAFTCAQVPSEENGFQGQNQQGWCNEEASELLETADVTIDEAARAPMIQDALRLMEQDTVLIPTLQFPKLGIYRTDRVGGGVEDQLNNYHAFWNINEWEDLDGDGEIVIGAEQWPGCLNPVTECANSSWYVWTVEFKLTPGVWETTDDGGYEITNLVAGEPVVEVAG
jgi:peptide/nickel transport system substrate-binding protein